MSLLKGITRFLFMLIAPILLIGAGALVSGWGIENEVNMLGWAGLVMIGAGILWGIILFMMSAPLSSFFD